MDIPTRTRRATEEDWLNAPHNLSTTPSGNTFYSTTPGGTRILYDRNALMKLRESPLSKTPPTNLAYIPGVSAGTVKPTSHATNHANSDDSSSKHASQPDSKANHKDDDEDQFAMD